MFGKYEEYVYLVLEIVDLEVVDLTCNLEMTIVDRVESLIVDCFNNCTPHLSLLTWLQLPGHQSVSELKTASCSQVIQHL